MINKTSRSLFYRAWRRLVFAYLAAFFISFVVGVFLIEILHIAPESIFEISTKRISYVFPLFESGAGLGADLGIILFFWNSLAALATISFLYTAALFNSRDILLFPRFIRKGFCGRKRMKLLCFLPGCLAIEDESIRRVYVWLMVPWLGMTLLGLESGLTTSTSAVIFGSYAIGVGALIPHGLVEIPTVSFAGAVSFSMHIAIREKLMTKSPGEIFKYIETFKAEVPLKQIVLVVLLFLFIAGLVEAHLTPKILTVLPG